MARSRARARLNWVSHGQRLGRCRVNRRAERVSRPTRAMRAVQRARCVKGAKKMGHWGIEERPDFAPAYDHAAHCAFKSGDRTRGLRYAKEARMLGMPAEHWAWGDGSYSSRKRTSA